MRIGVLVILTAIFCCSSVLAMDKRAPVNILPYKEQSVRLITQYSTSESVQYNISGTKISESENSALSSKLIYRNTFAQNMEFGLEVPYSWDKDLHNEKINGQTSDIDSSNGIGDVDLQLTYQFKDCREESFGFILGAEIKFPTGNEERGLGSGDWQMVYRTALVKKFNRFQPYVQAIYTDSYTGDVNGIDVNTGDDLFLAVGSKLRVTDAFRLEAKYFYDIATSRVIKESNDVQSVEEGYDIEGYRLKAEYQVTEHIMVETFYEHGNPARHKSTQSGVTIEKDPSKRDRIAVGITYQW